MKISVLQQKSRYGYCVGRDEPPLALLRSYASQRLEDCFSMLEEAGRRGSDLAVTIEAVNDCLNCADTRWPFAEVYEGIDGPTVRRFAETAKRWRMHVVAGLYLTEGGRACNCAVLFDGEGEIVGVHRKAHLPAGEERQITPGSRLDVFDTRLGRIGMLVCWDLQFPEAARIQALKGAELIAVPTLGWGTNGSLVQKVTFLQPGHRTFTLRASGSQCMGEYPHVNLRLDGKVIGEFDLDSEDMRDWTISPDVEIPAGEHEISLQFTNDLWDPETRDDRNIHFESFRIQ